MIKEYSSFNEAYRDIAKDLLNEGHNSHGTKEINNYSFKLKNIEDGNNILTCAPVNYAYMCGELLWYASADERLSFINKFHSTGMNRTSETAFANSAYGHIIFKRHGFNQVEQVISILSSNPDSRRAIINLNVPDRHRETILDEICTIALQFYINDGKLDCTGIMRSNDAFGCLPYDLAFFTELQKLIAYRLNIPTGSYTHFAVSFHAYERDFEKLRNVEKTVNPQKVIVDFSSICNNMAQLVKTIEGHPEWTDTEYLKLFEETHCLFSESKLI